MFRPPNGGREAATGGCAESARWVAWGERGGGGEGIADPYMTICLTQIYWVRPGVVAESWFNSWWGLHPVS
jgi:hypothetical protein